MKFLKITNELRSRSSLLPTKKGFGHSSFLNPQAFTLLELVLALSMSVVLMVLIGGALQFYARDMNVRDMDIRQTHQFQSADD